MTRNPSLAYAGDLALIVSAQKKRYLVNLEAGKQLQTHRGIINYDDLIGQSWGTKVYSHLGSAYLLLQPSVADLLLEIKRNTQIMYPKDVGYILMNMDIGPGKLVIEAGSGSGAFTTALAHMVGPTGHVFSYDNREALQNLARKNILKVGYHERVTFKVRDISSGFDESNVDAVFLDLPNPYDYLPQVRSAVKQGGFFGTILPTMNQVIRLLHALHQEKFSFIDVCEILLRYYKDAYARLRPTDRMVAHTGYLIFARPVVSLTEEQQLSEFESNQSDFDIPAQEVVE
jgi:tRNA (adenine57-N1/adenine58-N1)-methyltransferase